MDLNHSSAFSQLDPQNMLALIDALPDQLLKGWEIGTRSVLPNWNSIRQVLISGIGGSAIGADLLAAYVSPDCSVPLYIHRDYGLPPWARGQETLVIVSSYSGNTEEMISGFEQALERRCPCLVVSTGGRLGQLAENAGVPSWSYQHKGAPRTAVGYSFSLLLAALCKLNLLPDMGRTGKEVEKAVSAMRQQQSLLNADVPVVHNPAKRLAGQLMGHFISIFGAGILAPVARRWKGQFNENTKAWATFEFLPEANHNTLSGCLNPEQMLSNLFMIFLRSPSEPSRYRLRADLMRQSLMVEGINSDVVEGNGESALAHQWTSLHFGDYVSYYLAMAYDIDPTPITAIDQLKARVQSTQKAD